MRVSNVQMRSCVRRKEAFENSKKSVYAENISHGYVVWSYGTHFPMYFWDQATEQWFGNKDEYSQTTSRHQTMCCPSDNITWLDTKRMARLIRIGYRQFATERVVKGAR